MVAASGGTLAASTPAKPPLAERLATIDAQLDVWQPMVDAMVVRQGSDGRYQLAIKPATTCPIGIIPPSLYPTVTQKLDVQAQTLCALSQTLGLVDVRRGSDGRKQLVVKLNPTADNQNAYCPAASDLPDEARVRQHEAIVEALMPVMGETVFCIGSDGRPQALIMPKDKIAERCLQPWAP